MVQGSVFLTSAWNGQSYNLRCPEIPCQIQASSCHIDLVRERVLIMKINQDAVEEKYFVRLTFITVWMTTGRTRGAPDFSENSWDWFSSHLNFISPGLWRSQRGSRQQTLVAPFPLKTTKALSYSCLDLPCYLFSEAVLWAVFLSFSVTFAHKMDWAWPWKTKDSLFLQYFLEQSSRALILNSSSSRFWWLPEIDKCSLKLQNRISL